MTEAVNRFYNSIDKPNEKSRTEIIELFVYFLTVEAGEDFATPKQVADCFLACDLPAPAGTSVLLSRGLKSKPPRFIKVNGGYKLERHMRESLSKQLGAKKVTVQTSATLRSLEHKVPEGAARSFLNETIDCFEAGANRATITMAWILALDHLFAHILQHKLAEFNDALAKDKGVKLNAIKGRDDFTEIKENYIQRCSENFGAMSWRQKLRGPSVWCKSKKHQSDLIRR